MKKLFVLLALLAVGCQKKDNPPNVAAAAVAPTIPGSPSPVIKNITVLVMGQSNALYFAQNNGVPMFAADIQSFAPGAVAYVTCAEGGTYLADWMPGTSRYENCMTAIGSQKIDVILWDQGESEAEAWDPDVVADWAMNFSQLMGTLRARLGSNKLPLLYCRLGDDPGIPFLNQVRAQQEMVYLPGAHMVNLDGIPTDGLHYLINNGYAAVAVRYADAYKMLLAGE